ncbi:MAG: hypothetical protein AAGH68_01700 [Pseudomonadota bacterium]
MTEPFLVHAHIPKTGGSALNQRFLFPRFGQDRVQMLYRYVFEAAHRLPKRHTSPAMRCFAATGHVPYGFFSRVYPSATYLSVFREPLARSLSFLNFVLATPDHKVHERIGADPARNAADDPDGFVMAVLQEPRLATVQSNVQTRLASGCARLGEMPVDALHLDVAEANMARSDYLIGDQAQLARLIGELRSRYPIPHQQAPTPQPDPRTEKRLPKTLRVDALAPATVAALEQANRFDLALYEQIQARSANLAAA